MTQTKVFIGTVNNSTSLIEFDRVPVPFPGMERLRKEIHLNKAFEICHLTGN